MTQRKCPKCQHDVSGKSKFCPNCGEPLTKSAQEKASVQKKSSKNKSTSLRDTAIIVGILAVVAIVYFFVKDPAVQPQPPQQQFSQTDHPSMGMDESTMNMLNQLPADYNSLVQLGNQTMDARNYAMAAECYKRALTIDPSSPDVRTDYGACLHGMGLAYRAIEEFQRVLKEHPEHTIATFNLGIVFYGENKPDSAKYYWNKYLKIDPNGAMAPTAKQYLEQIEG